MIYSAGIIPFRINNDGVMEFFLGHSGCDTKNYWAFLKGHVEEGEKWVETAVREFREESGICIDDNLIKSLIPLGSVLQNAQKTVIAYGLYYPNIDVNKCHSNLIKNSLNAEIDKYRWMTFDELKNITHETHIGFYTQLMKIYNNAK